MNIEISGKTYEVLEILPRRHREYDLFVCKAPAGYKECFQRWDVEERKTIKKKRAPIFNIKF